MDPSSQIISMTKKRIIQAKISEKPSKKLKVDAVQEEQLVMFGKESIMKFLTEAINGPPMQRRNALRKLSDTVQGSVAFPIFDCIITWLMRPKLEDQETRFLMEATHRLLHKLDGKQTQHFVPKVIVGVQPFLDDKSHYMRGRKIIYDLSRIAGLDAMTAVIGAQMNDDSEYIRDMAAKAFGIVASALGISLILPFLVSACQSKESRRVRLTGIKTVEQIAICVGCSSEAHVNSLVALVLEGLDHKDLEVVRITALSLAALADVVAPYGQEAFMAVLSFLFHSWGDDKFTHRSGDVLAALVKLNGSIIPLVDPDAQECIAESILDKITELLEEPNEKGKEIALQALKRLTDAKNMSLDACRFDKLFRKLWGKTMLVNRKSYKVLVDVTISLASRLGPAYMKEAILKELEGYSKMYKELVIAIIEKALAYCQDASEDDAEFEDVFQDMIVLFGLPL